MATKCTKWLWWSQKAIRDSDGARDRSLNRSQDRVWTFVSEGRQHGWEKKRTNTETTMLSNRIGDYWYISQGKTRIPGVNDGEDMEATDVSPAPRVSSSLGTNSHPLGLSSFTHLTIRLFFLGFYQFGINILKILYAKKDSLEVVKNSQETCNCTS